MSEADLSSCVDLWKAAGLAHEADLAIRVSRLLRRTPNLCYVAEDDTGIAGCVLCSFNHVSAYVFRLVVGESRRSEGIGTALMQCLEDTARSAGAAKMILAAEGEIADWYVRQDYSATQSAFLFKVL